MRYMYDSAGARVGLGIKRAITVALVYTGSMAGCALAIMLVADGVARQAAPMMVPMLMPAQGSDASSKHASASKVKPAASNAAIIASVEARQASAKKTLASSKR
jgi:hypothetical protein